MSTINSISVEAFGEVSGPCLQKDYLIKDNITVALEPVVAPVSAGFFSGIKIGVVGALTSVQNSINNVWLGTVLKAQAAGTFALENSVSVAVGNKIAELASVEGVLKIGVAGVAASKGIEWVKGSVEAAKAVKKSYKTANRVDTLKASVRTFGQFAAGAATIGAAVALVVV